MSTILYGTSVTVQYSLRGGEMLRPIFCHIFQVPSAVLDKFTLVLATTVYTGLFFKDFSAPLLFLVNLWHLVSERE
jgi:hypothetical protein